MKGLETLVRLHRWQLDERRRELADIERLIAQLQAEAERLAEELKTEQAVARESESGSRAYGPYAQTIAVRQRRLAATIVEVEARAVAAREAVAEEFRELKRHEMTLAERERRAKAELERKNQAVLDEIGLNVHRRRPQS
jgi:flagellar protein FliJ